MQRPTGFYMAPSLLSADLLDLGSGIDLVERGGADFHHIDVMDGHYVPNLSFGLPVVEAVAKRAKIPLDVHLMIRNPEAMSKAYVEAGAAALTFHPECASHSHRLLQSIKALGVRAGVALNPGTPLSVVTPLLPLLDHILVMGVNPGFSGQKHIPQTADRIRELSALIASQTTPYAPLIQVDGGVSAATIVPLAKAGARFFVAGSAVYCDTSPPDQALQKLRQLLSSLLP